MYNNSRALLQLIIGIIELAWDFRLDIINDPQQQSRYLGENINMDPEVGNNWGFAL